MIKIKYWTGAYIHPVAAENFVIASLFPSYFVMVISESNSGHTFSSIHVNDGT